MFAQIPCRSIRWSPNNILAGRGATRWQSSASDPAPKPLYDNKRFTDALLELPGSTNEKSLSIGHASNLEHWEPSNEIDVLGLDPKARYLTHLVAGSESFSLVRFLIQDPYLYWVAKRAGRKARITLKKGGEYIVRDGIQSEFAGWWDNRRKSTQLSVPERHISNLIVTVPAGHIIRALEPIAHRLDHRSTICLIQDGLGVAEHIAEALFPDESRRPTFMLGHLETTLGFVPEQREIIEKGHLAVEELKHRRLLLTVLPPSLLRKGSSAPIKRHPPIEETERYTHLLRLLMTVPGLTAVKRRHDNFFYHKLSMTAFRCIIDPVATLLDITYDKVREHKFAQRLVENCVCEMADVISRFPEFKSDMRFNKTKLTISLREDLYRRIRQHKTADSRMRALVSRGFMTNVDFLTGYIVQRGRQLGANVNALETLMLSVKAKQMVSLQRQDEVVPFEEYYERDLLDLKLKTPLQKERMKYWAGEVSKTNKKTSP